MRNNTKFHRGISPGPTQDNFHRGLSPIRVEEKTIAAGGERTAEDVSPHTQMGGRVSRTSWRLNSKLSISHQKLNKERRDQRSSTPRKSNPAHGHRVMKPPSLLTATVSAVINWMLMFGLCCAYGMIMFSDPWHQQHRGLGVKMNLATAMIAGLVYAARSGICCAISGPDLNPVVFLAGFVDLIGKDLAYQLDLVYPEVNHRRLNGCTGDSGQWKRCLSTHVDESLFCAGHHLEANLDACTQYHQQLRATTIFATAVSSALLAVLLFVFGRCQLTRFVSYVPTSILEAFMSCVGYKVFKYALILSQYSVVQFAPAAVVGVLLYFLKAMHIGNPALVIPSLLLIPLVLFYAGVFSVGSDLDKMRDDGYMFPYMDNAPFWTVWTDSVGRMGDINIKAWLKTLPDLAVMILVVMLDCLLKLKGTESKIKGVSVDKDYEAQLGLCNLITALCGSSVGYMQLKFNVINFGVMGNLTDRRAGIMYAFLCGVGFFGTIEHFNFQPRFFLSMLLFFAGSGFVAENLWGSRKYLTTFEWCHIALILFVFILTETLLYAVVVGGLLCCLDFIVTYAKVPCVDGVPMRGGQFATSERYEPIVFNNLRHISNTWLLVIRLKGFIFFGSAQSMIAYLQMQIEAQEELPEYRRLRYLIMDCRILDGMDASAAECIKKVSDDARAAKITVLWAHVNKNLVSELMFRSILTPDSMWFKDLDMAIVYVQEQVYKYLRSLQQRWVRLHPGLALFHEHFMAQRDFEPFNAIMTMDSMRYGSPWLYCHRLELQQDVTVLWTPGDREAGLYLVHTGAVAIYDRLPEAGEEWPVPIAVHRHGSFLNVEELSHSSAQNYAVAVEDGEAVFWSERAWFKMMRSRPHMASALSRAVINQQAYEKELLGMSETQARARERAELRRVNSSMSSLTMTGSMSLNSNSKETKQDTRDKPHPLRLRVPEYLQLRLSSLHNAYLLDSYGLFDPIEDSCPTFSAPAASESMGPEYGKEPHLTHGCSAGDARHSMPHDFAEDLELAFTVYSHRQGSDLVLPRSLVGKALLYAGFPNVTLDEAGELSGGSLTHEEFLRVGEAAVMAHFCRADIAKIKDTFSKYDVDGSGHLDDIELANAIRQSFYHRITVEEIDCLTAVWDHDDSGKIEFWEFCKIISRFMKKHEQEWSLLMALRDVAGIPHAGLNHTITVESVLNWKKKLGDKDVWPISRLEVEEMLWAADWRTSGAGDGATLELRDVVATLIIGLRPPSSSLPPEPPHKPCEVLSGCATWSGHASDMRSQLPEDSSQTLRPRTSKPTVSGLRPHVPTGANDAVKQDCEADASAHDSGHLQRDASCEATVPSALRIDRFLGEVDPEQPGSGQGAASTSRHCSSAASQPAQGLVVDLRNREARERVLQNMGSLPRLDSYNSVGGHAARSASSLSVEPSHPPDTRSERSLTATNQHWTDRMYLVITNPSSSPLARVWFVTMLITVILSILFLVAYPVLEDVYESDGEAVPDSIVDIYFAFELYFTAIFSLEVMLRWVLSAATGVIPPLKFIRKLKNLFDFMAVTPLYLELILGGSGPILYLLRMSRLARVPRIARTHRQLTRGNFADSLFGAVLTVFAVIWGIFLKNLGA